MSNLIDLTGQKFGRLTVIERSYIPSKKTRWLCKCDCGETRHVLSYQLRSGKTKSCGCFSKDFARENFSTHNLSKEKLYFVHNTMNMRCHNENSTEYKNYGARGISVCDEWRGRQGVVNFYNWSLSNGYKEGLQIDRIDVNGNYEPNNCRWVSSKEQSINKRTNHLLNYNGETKTIKEFSEIYNIPYKTLFNRIVYLNWSIEKSLKHPVRDCGRKR